MISPPHNISTSLNIRQVSVFIVETTHVKFCWDFLLFISAKCPLNLCLKAL